MVGLMGCGKSAIGRRLAAALGLDFVDADAAIEQAAGCTIAEIFERFGEAEFREGEARVITRLLEGPPCVLATGGGAYMNDQTRGLINQSGIAVWLRADLDLLVRRTAGRTHRPLLNVGDPRQTLARLMDQRYPIYAQAAVVVDVTDESPEVTCRRVREALEAHGAVTALPPSP
jgi:shikimate kinase